MQTPGPERHLNSSKTQAFFSNFLAARANGFEHTFCLDLSSEPFVTGLVPPAQEWVWCGLKQ